MYRQPQTTTSTSTSGGNLLKKYANTKTIIYVALAVLFITLTYYIYTYKVAPYFKGTTYKANYEKVIGKRDGTQSEAEIMLFFTNWCPYCKAAKPIWQKIKTKYENKTVNGYNLIFTDVDCTNETAEVEEKINQYKIKGYPTIKMIKDGQVIEFDANVTEENLDQFINTAI